MRRFTNSFVFLVFVFWSFLLFENVSAAAPALSQETELVEHTYPEKVQNLRRGFLEQGMPVDNPPQDPEGLEEEEEGAAAEESFVFTEDEISKLAELSSRSRSGFKRGARTTFVGLLATLGLLVIHFLSQHFDGRPIDEELVFERGTGKLTFTGVGLVLGLTALGVGIGEMVLSLFSAGGANKFDWTMLNKVLLDTGRHVSGASGTAIVVGWLLGFPLVLMELAGSTFFAGWGLSLVGFVYMLRDHLRALRLAEWLRMSGDKAASKRTYESLIRHIERKAALMDILASAEAQAELLSMSAAKNAAENEELEQGEETAAEAGLSDEEEQATGESQPAAETDGAKGDAKAEN